MFGNLTLKAFMHDSIQTGGVLMMLVCVFGAIGVLFYLKRWKWFWKEWLTSLDPKKIGVMYLVMTALMLLKGFSDGLLMRIQQMTSVGDAQGLLTADHYQQIFSAHGATMIFFVGMGFIFAMMN